MPNFFGNVEEIRYIPSLPSKYQVVLVDGEKQLIAVTGESAMRSLIELAFIANRQIEVEYKEDGPGSWMLLAARVKAT